MKLATILVAGYGVIWISLEGSLPRVAALAVGVSLVMAGHILQRTLGGRSLPIGRWLLIAAATGLLVGISCGLLTLGFMALKTGLHGHGPEFRASEIIWVLRQVPLWGAAGLLAGLGLGFLSTAGASQR